MWNYLLKWQISNFLLRCFDFLSFTGSCCSPIGCDWTEWQFPAAPTWHQHELTEVSEHMRSGRRQKAAQLFVFVLLLPSSFGLQTFSSNVSSVLLVWRRGLTSWQMIIALFDYCHENTGKHWVMDKVSYRSFSLFFYDSKIIGGIWVKKHDLQQ